MSVELTDDQKQEERVKAQQYAELMKIPYVDPFPPTQREPPTPKQINLEDLSEEELLAIVNKRNGTALTSLQELKPKPSAAELETQAREREASMLSYGITSGKFKKEDYDAYHQAIGNKMAIVKEEITAQFTTMFPELDAEAIKEKVANYLFENLDPADSTRQAREKELIDLAGMRINTKYENIVNLPKDYAQYEEGMNNKATFDRKVQATLPVYTSDVNRALQSLKHFSVEIPDTKNPERTVSVDLEYDDNDLQEVSELLLEHNNVVNAVKEGSTFDQIKGQAELVLVKKHLPRLISQAAKKYNSIQKDGYINGRKGLNAGSDHLAISDDGSTKSTVDAMYDELIASGEKNQK